MKGRPSKERMIAQLEGKTIETADGEQHVVNAGGFFTKSGAFVKLKTLHPFHVEIFWKQTRQGGQT